MDGTELSFQWDKKKTRENLKKHSISFEEANSIFTDHLSLTIEDEIHSEYEDHFIRIGMSKKQHLLVIVYTERNETIVRIISARRATHYERTAYEEGDY